MDDAIDQRAHEAVEHDAKEPLQCSSHAFTTGNPSTQHYHSQLMDQDAVRHSDPADFSQLKRLENGQLQCNKCDFAAWQSFVMDHHRKKHHELAESMSAFDDGDDDLEYEPGHPSGKDYKCRRYDHRSANRNDAMKHVKCHTKPYACTQCKKRFSRSTRLEEHMEFHVNGIRLQCERCKFTTNSDDTMYYHCKMRHDCQDNRDKRYDRTISLHPVPLHLVDHLSASTGLEYASYRTHEVPPNKPNTGAYLPSGSESIDETEGWLEMESIELDDGVADLEEPSSVKAAVTEVKAGTGASGSDAAAVDKSVQRQRCPICGAWSSRGNLRRHMLVHTKREPLICAVCGKGILCLSSLKTHMMLVHSDESPFGCVLCTSRFKFQSGLATHMKTAHGQTPENVPYKSSKQYQCTICLRAYASKERLRSHMLVHIKQERLLCTTCGKGFRNEVALKKHLVVHSSEKQLTCDLCTTTFKNRRTMTIHMRRLHGMGGEHRCEQCSRVFASAKRLTRHQETRCESMLVAKNRNSHFCPHCGKGFVAKCNLTAHLVIHSDERPFACSECDFTAKRRYVLTRHQRWHTGELFKCEHCDYAHPQKAVLDRHLKVHVSKPRRVKNQKQRYYACKYVPLQ